MLKPALVISAFTLGSFLVCSSGMGAVRFAAASVIAKPSSSVTEVRYRHRVRRYGPYGLYWRSRYLRAHYVGEVFGLPVIQIRTNRVNTHLP